MGNKNKKNSFYELLTLCLEKLENAPFVAAVRGGLIMSIPVLMFGAFALIFQFLPIDAYQNFITSFANGLAITLFSFVNTATFGMLSLYMTAFISVSYVRQKPNNSLLPYGAPICSLICFAILAGMGSPSFSIEYFGVKGMFTAIVCAYLCSCLYIKIYERLSRKKHKLKAQGADAEFNNAVSVIMPAIIVIGVFSLFRIAIMQLFGVSGLHELFILGATKLFMGIKNRFWSGLLFVLISSALWFFGIHGSDVLEGVSETLFVPGAVEAVGGAIPDTVIVTKSFIDTFVLMGGCGTAIALLIAILLFSERRANRSLAKMSVLPMIFNINEMMIFGLPVVLNPCFLIPFILVPLTSYLVSYGSMHFGLVPVITFQTHWTTPILLGGYRAVGSFYGAALQLCCVMLGVLIYLPFVNIYDEILYRKTLRCINELTSLLKEREEKVQPITLTELRDERGSVAKILAADLKDAIEGESFTMYYQPQYHHDGHCIGAEALLRWNHYQAGMIYPPLVIKLSEEIGMLETLEKQILNSVVRDLPSLYSSLGEGVKISVNVTGTTLQSESYIEYLKELMDSGRVKKGDIWLEITEQKAFLSHHSDEAFSRIREIGYPMAIDDFSMGHTSLKYLQMNPFDQVKLDGSLVRQVVDNKRVREIISSIVYLSQTLHFNVLAEFVETEEQKEALAAIGCMLYQGYLFSPAKPPDELGKKQLAP